eukprot:1157328-Pelagomonas_calceolata.AAC.20
MGTMMTTAISVRAQSAYVGVPLGSVPGWDDRKQSKKPLLPLYPLGTWHDKKLLINYMVLLDWFGYKYVLLQLRRPRRQEKSGNKAQKAPVFLFWLH